MWNDTDEPLAIFVTFRTYGTWLPGDDRGTINRHHNKYGTIRIRPVSEWVRKNKERMNREPVVLGPRQRATVRKVSRNLVDFAVGEYLPSTSEQTTFTSSLPLANETTQQ